MFQRPHPPDTAPPKSKFDEIFSKNNNIFLSATKSKKNDIGGKADNSTDGDGAPVGGGAGGGGIGNLFKKALNINGGGKKSEPKKSSSSSSKETKNHQPEELLLDTPFFLCEQGKAVESSFESLEGGMDAGLQLSSTTTTATSTTTTTSPEELQKQREEEKKKTNAMVDQFTSSLSSTLKSVSTTDNAILSPLIQGKVESQVPEQAIKGAILASVVLTAMAGKGAAMSGAAGLGAAYVAITAGPVGQAVRALGGLTWDVANKGIAAYEKAEQQGQVDAALRTMAEYQLPETWDNIAAERALWDTKRPEYWNKQNELTRRSLLAYRLTMEARQRTERATLAAIEEAHKRELATLQREQAKRTEEARLAAEEARLAIEASKLAEEMRLQEEKAAAVEEEQRSREAKRLQTEAKRLEKERARAVEEEAKRLEQQAEQVRLAKEKEMAEAAEKERLQNAETARLETEAKAREQEEARLQAQEERLVETAKQTEQARILAANQKDDDDLQGQFDEDDWEASIRAAQQSIDGNIAGLADSLSFIDDGAKADWDRASQKAQGLGKKQQRKQPEDDDDVEEEMDLEAIAIAARKAVKAFEQQAQTAEKGKKAQRQQWEDDMVTDSEIDDDDAFYDDDVVDYSGMTMSELRGELKRRGLPASGGKKDLVRMLEEEDLAEDDLFDKDVDELEYFEMSVAELKEELQRRGLPISGGKKDMVSRLEKDDMADDDEDDLFDDRNDLEAVAYVGGPFGTNSNEDMNGIMARARGSSPSPTDFEGLARAAREAVEMFESGGETDRQDADDWSTFTVAELREELRNRGLSTKGKKTELVALLQNSDLELAAAEGEDDLDDINAIGLAEREAFDSMVFAPASADDEPSDEALWEIEQDAILATEVLSDVADYDSMTIAQLKDELRGRGLRLSGKKNELIERLRASSSS
jgi:SAP domain